MKRVLSLFCLGLFTWACSSNADEEKSEPKVFRTQHYNIIIAPDLSNRVDFSIRQKPLKDLQIAEVVLKNLYPKILNSANRSESQKDRVRFDFINKNLITKYGVETNKLELNFGEFKNQGKRMDYIKGRAERSLQEDREKFMAEYEKIHSTAEKNNFGADIWTYLKGLDNSSIITSGEVNSHNNIEYHHNYKNVMFLLTDGYIEAGLFGQQGCKEGNQCYYLSSNRIKEFRNAFKRSGESDLKQFFEKNGYGIVPVDNPILENVEILALEFNDRSLDHAGNATVYPTDYEILELFWTDWMEKSGVKRFKMKRTLTSEMDAEQEILGFMGVR
ncbi:hypothetical protein KI659_17645 [Litoribacter alkaliphilus]|uniref:Lipoprotein n=1 Tax=Litoribacter ruber TaxID=702568 RepID=A0AAP2CL88_9BACT|nr:hypothetical protein [Litoribacter alkaliphilus]MBS9525849.1 hypothetical protein [Litoribacter alkaliphilus]